MSRFTVLTIAVAVQSVSAFAPAAMCPQHKHISALYLVPEQGRQLVAFSQEYLSKKAGESASRASNLHTSARRRRENVHNSRGGLPGLAKNLVSRLLFDAEKPHIDVEEDVVKFPIVGFTLVDGHALPSPDQKTACSIKMGDDEEVVGYWNPTGGDAYWS